MLASITRRSLLLAAGCTAASATLAQTRQAQISIAPAWRPPQLLVSGAERPVRLQALTIEVEVAGGVAQTRIQMEFFNPNSRILEGKLQFPLAAGQVVSGFALDINGELRDAVPVDKARAEQVFEDITRRRVDPGLLQSTLGNNYELRIYPLAPGKTRTVALTIVEPTGARLQVPLGYASSVDRLDVSLRCASALARPEIESGAALGLSFQPDARGGFVARTTRLNAALPRDPLLVQMKPAQGIEITTQEKNGESYFTLSVPVSNRSAPRPLPQSVQIIWDASASGANRQQDREFALLDAYFQRVQSTTVTLTRVADVVAAPERFIVQRGDWSALRRALQATVYDGASQLSALRHDGTSAEALWFSDGLANYGAPWRLKFPVPVYAINSAASSDFSALRGLADASGGRSIDLSSSTVDDAVRSLLTRGAMLVEMTGLGATDLVSEARHAEGGRLNIAGQLSARNARLTLAIRGSDGAVSTRNFAIDAQQNPSSLAAVQWARLSLASLEGERRNNQQRIREIGRRFGLATRETSLLVLERVEDYVQHEIEPPPSLQAAYDKLVATAQKSQRESDAARLAQVVKRFEARVGWWHRDFPKGDRPKPPVQISKSVAQAPAGALEQRRERSNSATNDAMSAPPAAPAPMVASRLAASEAAALRKDANAASSAPNISIALKPAASNAQWTKRLQAADADAQMAIYLDERRANAMSVGFFLDAAEFFLQNGQRAVGLRVLSNLAEMDLQNRQVLRLLGYRLQQAGEIELAISIFERVLELAPNEPQSHRDLGLALAQSGQPQLAIDRLYEVVTGSWDGRFADIDLIALNELNAVHAKAERESKRVDVSAIDPRLLKNLPLDLRVVLAWDADATDVDLHVIDPNGEEVYYGHNLSYQGGTISHDATGGYGPEEFMLRKAKPGKYRVEANFYGHRQQVLTSSTGLMLWLTSGFGSAGEQSQRTTLRLKSEGGQRVVVGEFEVTG